MPLPSGRLGNKLGERGNLGQPARLHRPRHFKWWGHDQQGKQQVEAAGDVPRTVPESVGTDSPSGDESMCIAPLVLVCASWWQLFHHPVYLDEAQSTSLLSLCMTPCWQAGVRSHAGWGGPVRLYWVSRPCQQQCEQSFVDVMGLWSALLHLHSHQIKLYFHPY